MKTFDEIKAIETEDVIEKNTIIDLLRWMSIHQVTETNNVLLAELIAEHEKIIEKFKTMEDSERKTYTINKHEKIIEFLETFLDKE